MATPSVKTDGKSAGKLKRGLGSSRKKLSSLFADLFLGPKKIEGDFFKDLESALLSVDIGPKTVNDMLGSLVDKLPRTSLSEPKILLIDEPISNQDKNNKIEIIEIVSDFIEQKDIICILVSHDEIDIKGKIETRSYVLS